MAFWLLVLGLHHHSSVSSLCGCSNGYHKHIAHASAIPGYIKQRILSVKNRFLQPPFRNVVVQGRPWLAQEQSQAIPMLEQVADRYTQSRVWFHRFSSNCERSQMRSCSITGRWWLDERPSAAQASCS